jgi:hypothetical protein
VVGVGASRWSGVIARQNLATRVPARRGSCAAGGGGLRPGVGKACALPWLGLVQGGKPAFTGLAEPLVSGFARGRGAHRRRPAIEGSGHFRVKIYAKPETMVFQLYTAKKWSVFHTELHPLWSIKTLPTDMTRIPRQWRASLMAPFFPFGAAHGGEETDHRCSRLRFSSTASPSLGLVWSIKEPATCGKVSKISLHSVEKSNTAP